jgi:hypothetical protein
MAEALLEAIPFDVAALGVYLGIAKLSLRWDIVPKRTSEYTGNVDLE